MSEPIAEYVCDECGAELTGWNAAVHHEWMFHDRKRTTRPVARPTTG